MLRNLFIFCFCCFAQLLTSSAYICQSTVDVNRSPVIGVLAQETWNDGRPPNNTVIVAGYVKYLEMAGAQVVPVLLNKSDQYYDTLYRKLNGLLLPGGILLNDSIYMRTAKIFWLKATNNNTDLSWRSHAERRRNFFPIWGTCLGKTFFVVYISGLDHPTVIILLKCLNQHCWTSTSKNNSNFKSSRTGMEAMLDFISGEPSRFTRCNAFDTADPVNLTYSNEALRETSSLFRDAPETMLNVSCLCVDFSFKRWCFYRLLRKLD